MHKGDQNKEFITCKYTFDHTIAITTFLLEQEAFVILPIMPTMFLGHIITPCLVKITPLATYFKFKSIPCNFVSITTLKPSMFKSSINVQLLTKYFLSTTMAFECLVGTSQFML
jgi:hypothetical protein